jgi:hypothetical protein
MKERKETKTRTITEEVVWYEAYDGERFDSEEECKKYEATATAAIEKAFYGLMVGGKPLAECDIWANFGYGSEEFEVAIIDINDEHDLEIANRFYIHNKASNMIPKSYIGKRVLVDIGYGFDSPCRHVEANPQTMDELIVKFTKDMDKWFNPKEEKD